MNAAIIWFAENRVAANMLMVIIIAAGVLALPATPKEVWPNISFDIISVSTAYPGASPTEVESAVCSRVESAIYDIEGIKTLSGSARENFCEVRAQLAIGYESRPMMEKIKSRVDSIANFPEGVKRPIVKELAVKNLVARIVISGKANERALKELAEQVRDDLLLLPGITQVLVGSTKSYEISLEVSEAALQRYDLTFSEVVQVLRQNSLKVASGQVDTEGGKVSIVADGLLQTGEDFESMVLRADPQGGQVRLGDVAQVTDGFRQSNAERFYNGDPAVSLAVYQVGDQSILEISDMIHQYVATPSVYLPEGISINIWQDSSVQFKSRMNLLSENAFGGLVLVFFALLLFLRLKLAFWVTVGIPVAFLGGFALLLYYGETINMISTFAFLLVLGIVVDDAIIVGENIFSKHDEGIFGVEAAKQGALEIAKPVVFAILTTIVAFGPMLFFPGAEGKLVRVIPVVVIAILIFSLVESLLILPAHLSTIEQKRKTEDNIFTRLNERFGSMMKHVIDNYYEPLLNKVLYWRYASVAVFISIFIVSLSMMIGGWINVRMVSTIEADIAVADVAFPQGTSVEKTRDAVRRMEASVLELRDRYAEETGAQQIGNISSFISSDSKGRVVIELASAEKREISGDDIMQRWRETVGPIADTTSLTYEATFNKPGPDIDVELSGENLDELREISQELRETLATYPGVYDVRDSFQAGKREVHLELKPSARNLGLNLNELARQVGQAFKGTEVQSLTRGRDEVKVMVRYPRDENNSLWYLENMSIRLNDGSNVPLMAVANVSYSVGPAEIKRQDRRRVINTRAYVDPAIASDRAVMKQLQNDFLDKVQDEHPKVRWQRAGAQKERSELQDFILSSYLFSLMAMYVLMATLFRSYMQPVMVMTAIPFGLVGALFGHLLLGMEVTVFSLIGMVAVSGVVVNDNFVLIDYINRKRLAGAPLSQAIRDAGKARFRPIMLTSLTTFVGLLPVMLEKSVQAQFLVPLAVSLSFGVMFATMVSLLLIPALYHIIDDAKRAITHSGNPEETAEGGLSEVSIEHAYNLGYAEGLVQKNKRVPTRFATDVLRASWEAGFDDARASVEKGDDESLA